MSNNRYLEIDSTYRDRNLWPLASEFQIPISQSGRKTMYNAIDPVSTATPIFAWTSNYLDTAIPNSYKISGTFTFYASTGPGDSQGAVVNTSDLNTLIIYANDGHSFQQLTNYYSGLEFYINNTPSGVTNISRRILSYNYIGQVIPGYDSAQITLSSPLPDSLFITNGIYSWSISDSTDFSNTINPYIFVPAGRIQQNAYCNYLLYNETLKQYRPIISYDSITHLLGINTNSNPDNGQVYGPVTRWSSTNSFCIRKNNPIVRSSIINLVDSGSTINNIIVNNSNNLLSYSPDYYKYQSLRISPSGANGYNTIGPNYNPINASNITASYTGPFGSTISFSVYPPIKKSTNTFPLVEGDTIEILPFSYDNFNPFVYTGSLVSQQEMVCYEIELLNLILPNAILACGEGGRIAFYPYVYVTLSNVSASGAGLTNILYSNNPNATRVIFRVPIDDLINPLISTFVHLDGDGMVQTMKFKPNDNLYFSVTLANGEKYQTVLPEYYSPSLPNPAAQISACFTMKRL